MTLSGCEESVQIPLQLYRESVVVAVRAYSLDTFSHGNSSRWLYSARPGRIRPRMESRDCFSQRSSPASSEPLCSRLRERPSRIRPYAPDRLRAADVHSTHPTDAARYHDSDESQLAEPRRWANHFLHQLLILPAIGFVQAIVDHPLSFQVQGTNIRTSKVPLSWLLM
jgi:hypothetical protein